MNNSYNIGISYSTETVIESNLIHLSYVLNVTSYTIIFIFLMEKGFRKLLRLIICGRHYIWAARPRRLY